MRLLQIWGALSMLDPTLSCNFSWKFCRRQGCRGPLGPEHLILTMRISIEIDHLAKKRSILVFRLIGLGQDPNHHHVVIISIHGSTTQMLKSSKRTAKRQDKPRPRTSNTRGPAETRRESALVLKEIVEPKIGRRLAPNEPTPFTSIFTRRIKRRLKFSAAVNTAVSAQDITQLSGMMAVSPTLGVPIIWSFRLKKIEIWSPVQTSGTSVTCSIADTSVDSTQNDFNGSYVKVVDESISFDRPAHVWMKPAPSTPMGSWHNGQPGAIAVNLFGLQCPLGSIVDITMDVVDGFNTNANSYTQTLIGASVGTTYCHPLFGTGNSTVEGVTNV